jgi:CRP/FNR family cyclic AMP-dependent transcriptional regulator
VTLFDPVSVGARVRPVAADGQVAALVDIDPDLARSLPPDRWSSARQEVPVRVVVLPRGSWAVERLAVKGVHLGVLVVDGIIGRELLAYDVASMELLGSGDVLRPWDECAESELLRAEVRWSALADTQVALLDRHVAVRLANYPEIHAALLERCAWRARRLAVMQTISQLNRVDRRVLTLLWHLAERWGRVTSDGVVVPLPLSHRTLGQLVGARRPTVTGALAELARTGEVVRGEAGTWILPGSPVGAPSARASQSVAPRRAMPSRQLTV